MQTLKLIVREVRQESPLIRSFRLAREGRRAARLRSGRAPEYLRPRPARAAQFAGAADAGRRLAAPGEYRLGVRLEEDSQGGSRHMHALVEGDTLAAEGPRNDFPLHEAPAGDEPVLLIAGIGITPVASMAAALPPAAPSTCITAAAARTSWPSPEQALAGDSLSLHGDDDPASRFDLQALLDAASPRQHLSSAPG